MPQRFRVIDRDTPMLMPPDLRDWVGEDDLVHFVIEAVDRLPLSSFHVNYKGTGSKQLPPHTMLALLVFCYSYGVFSSRRIERATHRDVAVRYLCGDTQIDHDTICTFRRKNRAAIEAAFVDILELARELKLLKLGAVSLDGTHIKANASKDKNITYARAQELRAQLKQDVQQLLLQAEQADQEDSDPQALPKAIAKREKLLSKIDAACAELEKRAQERAAREQAEYERKLAARKERGNKGPESKAPSAEPKADEQVNLTDADARLMRKNRREGYTESYNAQAVVDADGGSHLIVGQRVSPSPSDSHELEPDLAAIPESLGTPEAVLADCGYAKKEVIQRFEGDPRLPELYVSVHREDAHSEREYDYRPPERRLPAKEPKDPVLIAMRDKLRTEEGKTLYRKRGASVETVFGTIKGALGFRQFHLRGREKVSGEWTLVCLAYNVKRLFNLKHVAQQA